MSRNRGSAENEWSKDEDEDMSGVSIEGVELYRECRSEYIGR